MKKHKIAFLVTALLLLCGGLAQATVNLYHDDIIAQSSYDDFTIEVLIHDEAVVEMVSGEIGGVHTLNSSIFNLNDGSVANLAASDTSTINLLGGDIRQGFQGWDSTAEINIYGYDFVTSFHNERIYLSGKWENGSEFNFYFFRASEVPEIVNLYTIPEPASLTLLTFGIFYLRRFF